MIDNQRAIIVRPNDTELVQTIRSIMTTWRPPAHADNRFESAHGELYEHLRKSAPASIATIVGIPALTFAMYFPSATMGLQRMNFSEELEKFCPAIYPVHQQVRDAMFGSVVVILPLAILLTTAMVGLQISNARRSPPLGCACILWAGISLTAIVLSGVGWAGAAHEHNFGNRNLERDYSRACLNPRDSSCHFDLDCYWARYGGSTEANDDFEWGSYGTNLDWVGFGAGGLGVATYVVGVLARFGIPRALSACGLPGRLTELLNPPAPAPLDERVAQSLAFEDIA